MSTPKTQNKGPQFRNYYETFPDSVLARVPVPDGIFKSLAALASHTGLTPAQVAALLLGPQPGYRLNSIMQARLKALAHRRQELAEEQEKKSKPNVC